MAADLTGQANHLGVTIQADIIKQKLPEINGGFRASSAVKHQRPRIYISSPPTILLTLPLPGGQLLHGPDRPDQLRRGRGQEPGGLCRGGTTAVINKRAGGMGLISGRKAFQRPMEDGVRLLNAIQDVYLAPDVTIA